MRAGPSRALIMRGAGDSLVEVGSGVNRVLVASGARLPGSGRPLIRLGSVASAPNGTAIFVASFPAGIGVYMWRAGEVSLVIDSVSTIKGPGGGVLNWVPLHRHRELAVNNRGETVFFANTGGINRLLIIAPGDTQARAIATIGAPLLGGTLNSIDQVAIDDDGRVSFTGRLSNRASYFFWDKTKVELLEQSGPATATKPALSDFFSIASSGREHYALFNYSWGHFELRSYDGLRWADVTSTADPRAGNLALRSSYGTSQLSRTCYLGQPLEGTVGAYCAKPDGKIGIVARLGDRLPGGGTLLTPLGVTVTETGDIYLAAQLFENGREFVALYLASSI